MFKVMTWNLENLFRPHTEGGPESEAVYQEKLEGLAATINAQAPDALSVQEVGDPAALDDLVQLLDGSWHQRVSQHPDQRHIRVAWLTQHEISGSEDVLAVPEHLEPVQVDDTGTSLAEMGRGAVAVTIQRDTGSTLRLVTTHLKSKLLTFPGGRFQPDDEGQRARFAAYALYRRAAEAATLRVWATAALGSSDPLILTGDLNDTVQAATTQLLQGPPRFRDRNRGLRPPRPRRHTTALESRAVNARRQELLAHQQRPQRTDRPHPRLRRTRQTTRVGQRRSRDRPAPALR